MVAPLCNPSYSGGKNQEDLGLRPAQESGLGWRGVSEIPSQQNSLRMVVHTCHLSYTGGIGRNVTVQAGLNKNMRPYLKNN
jgi:hypothetical protein